MKANIEKIVSYLVVFLYKLFQFFNLIKKMFYEKKSN